MKADIKYELGQTVKTVQGSGNISMIGITKAGTRYLVDLENDQGKCWQDEAELDKDVKPKGAAKGAAETVVSLIVALLLWFAFGGISQAAQGSYTATDGYVSAQESAPTTNYTEVVFSGAPTKTIRLTAVDYESETNTAFLHLYSGTTPYTITGVSGGTNLTVTSNAGIVTNQLCILQAGGTNWTALIVYTNQLTNIVLYGSSTLGFTVPTNTVLWQCNNRYLTRVDVVARQIAGEAIFAAQVRAPLAVRLDPGVVTSNRLNATVKYGSYDATVSTP